MSKGRQFDRAARTFLRRKWQLALIIAASLAGLAAWHFAVPPKAEFVEFPMLQAQDIPTAIAASTDGAVWFTIDSANAVGRIREGKVERLPKPTTNLEPIGIAAAADGAAWYTDAPARQVSRIAPSGEISSVTLDTPIARLGKIAVALDGGVWFAEATAFSITRLKNGKLARHVIDSIRGGPYGVATSADGVVWATLQAANQILRIAPDGAMRAFDIPTRSSSPTDIAVDAAGNVWFAEFRGNKIGRLANGRFEEFSLGEESVGLTGLAVAGDGSVWFGMLRRGSLGRLRGGEIEAFKLPRDQARPYSVDVDRSGNVWYTDISGYVGMLKAEAAKR